MRVCICVYTHALQSNLFEMKLLSVLAWNIKILVNKIFVNILVVGEMLPSLSLPPFLFPYSYYSFFPYSLVVISSLYLYIYSFFFFQHQLVFVSRLLLLLLLWMKRLLIHEKDFLNNEGGVNKARDRLSSWHLILVTFFPRWQKYPSTYPLKIWLFYYFFP